MILFISSLTRNVSKYRALQEQLSCSFTSEYYFKYLNCCVKICLPFFRELYIFFAFAVLLKIRNILPTKHCNEGERVRIVTLSNERIKQESIARRPDLNQSVVSNILLFREIENYKKNLV